MKRIVLALLMNLAVARLLAQPIISHFSPSSGPVGTTVTITGSGFNAIPSNNVVSFGGIGASVLTASANTLTVRVPAGATYQPITVTVGGLTGVSSAGFDLTFPGGGVPFTPASFVPAGNIYTITSSLVSGLADFNGDGKTDIFSVEGMFQGLTVYVNNTVGHNVMFGQVLTLNTPSPNHSATATADLDGDGMPDIVITNSGQSISIYRNTSLGGTVSFAANQDFAAKNDPMDIAVGDLDGDGKPDIAVADGSGGVISIFRNTSTPGNISFAARVDLNPGSAPTAMAVRDLDGDGRPDLIFFSTAGLGTMRNLSSPGNFSFDTFSSWATGGRLVSLRASDIDGDGKPDLAAADILGNSLTLVRNTSTPGSISFAAAQNLPGSLNPNRVEIADMDGDGKPDLVSSNINYPNVSVFRNTGSVGALAFDPSADYMLGNVSLSFSGVADMDANGRPDIIGGSRGYVIYGNMVGAAPAVISSYFPIQGVTGTIVTIKGKNFTSVTSVHFGDSLAQSFVINSDSVITAIVGGGSSGNLTVENPDATATGIPAFLFFPPLIRDFYPTVANKGDTVTIFGSNFTSIKDVKFGNFSAASFTVDSLGGITAIVGNGGTGDISVISPNGTATAPGFSFSPPVITGFSPISGPVGAVVTITGRNFSTNILGEYVRFGAVKAPIISATATAIRVKVPPGASYNPITVTTPTARTAFSSKPFQVTFPSDDPTITTNSFKLVGTFPTLNAPSDAVVSDLDGDGTPDLVVLDQQASNFSLFLSRSAIGKIDLPNRTDYFAMPDPIRILLQDMNGDGRPEIIVLHDGPITGTLNPSNVEIISNNLIPGGGAIGGQFTIPTTNGTQGIAVTDINGDGLPDIVVSNGSAGTITVFPNTTWFGGDIISFGRAIDFPAIGHPDYLIATDIDQDGNPDIVAVDRTRNIFTLYRNTSKGGKVNLAAGVDQPTPASSGYLVAGDLDGDGLPDLVSAAQTTNAAIADLNGDGMADLGFGRATAGLFSLWQNKGATPINFTPTIDMTSGQGETRFFTSDLDGDSKPDLIVTNPGQNSVTIYRNTIGDPVITGVSPDTAYKGTLVRLTGRNLASVSNISFGGVPADSVKGVSATEIDAVVGRGASGPVTVTTSFGIGSIGGFVFIPQIKPQGDTIFCKGSSVRLLSTAASNNTWFKDGVPVGNDTILVADSAGSYTVSTVSNGVTTTSPVQKLALIIIPPPTITDSANWLVSSAPTANQWYYNTPYNANFTTPVDTMRIIRPGPIGGYSVTTTREGCTSDPSKIFYWGGTQAIQLPDDQFITYYPNPVTDYLVVFPHTNGQPLLMDLTLMDNSGRIVAAWRQTQQQIIEFTTMPVGIYFLRIHADGAIKVDKTVRILKIRR